VAHWKIRPEAKWKEFSFNQPYAKGLKRLRRRSREWDDYARLVEQKALPHRSGS
jgi:hypothetical protein